LEGTIYTTDIVGGPAGTAIAVARVVDGKYEALKRLSAPVNVDAQDMYPHIAPDESYLVFQSRRASQSSASGLFVSFRNPNGTWGDPRPIDLGGLRGGLPFVSPDGKYLFFTAGERGKGDIYWVEARFLKDRAPAQDRPAAAAIPATAATATAAVAAAPAAPAAPAELPRFELMAPVGEGRILHARLSGGGSPTVVLVSGFNAPQEYWNPIVDTLAAEATVVTYDRAGVGKSELGTLPAHARQSAADLRRLLEVLKAPKPWLFVGHSLGARIVKIFASMYPEEVGGLVLMDGVPANILEEQKKILSGADLELLERMTAGRPAPAEPRTEADASLVSLEQERTMGPLPRVPVLVLIAGDREKNVPPGFSPEARKRMAQLGMDLQKTLAADLGGTFIVFEGVGHGLHTEKPEAVAAAILDMVRKVGVKPKF
ncbi:MAG: alpha/beta fold hydrolase, partial [Spirochaetales bacterium]|nr:alpha/beta fold hydrolase [Spirochaetales bacterium]